MINVALSRKDPYTRLAALLFFAWITLMFTTPVGEGDYFWHVKTGQWIWQHKSLPTSDPFSFTVGGETPPAPDSGRVPFLLKQYWLGQLIFYGLWKLAGPAGMVLLRAIAYTGILIGLYRFGRRLTTSASTPLLVVLAVGSVLRNYSNERPQLFAYLLMPLLLALLERLRTASPGNQLRWPALFIPLTMFIWGNCHGSFILGMVVIGLAAIGILVDDFRQGHRQRLPIMAILAGGLLAPLLNPNGLGAFQEFFALAGSYTSQVAEFTSPIRLARQHGVLDYAYWGTVVVTILVLANNWRRLATPHLLLLWALAGLSLTATRYVPFFMFATPLLCHYAPQWQNSRLFRFIPLLLLLLLIGTANYGNVLKFREERAFPAKACQFLREANPSGNMFNYIGWGGYLMCYSRYPVFIDGRTLVVDLLPVHNQILAGREWKALLDRYSINFMIIPGTDAISLQAYPLLLQLLGDSSWELVYLDEVALVLIRHAPENQAIIDRYALAKEQLTSHIQARWQWQMANDF